MLKLIAIIFGDELFVGRGYEVDELKDLAEEKVDELKDSYDMEEVNFCIQEGYKIICEFTL